MRNHSFLFYETKTSFIWLIVLFKTTTDYIHLWYVSKWERKRDRKKHHQPNLSSVKSWFPMIKFLYTSLFEMRNEQKLFKFSFIFQKLWQIRSISLFCRETQILKYFKVWYNNDFEFKCASGTNLMCVTEEELFAISSWDFDRLLDESSFSTRWPSKY